MKNTTTQGWGGGGSQFFILFLFYPNSLFLIPELKLWFERKLMEGYHTSVASIFPHDVSSGTKRLMDI